MKDQILFLRSLGYTYSQIQTELGCSKGTISYYLGAGQKEKTRNRVKDKRNLVRRYVQDQKQNSACADCGEDYPYWMMQFDHLSDKEFTIGNYAHHKTLDQVKAEVAKCEVVCANCHANRTYLRKLSTGNSAPDISHHY